MEQNIWEYDDFIFKGDELKGMTQKGKDKVKLEGKTDLVIPELTPDGLPLKKIGDNAFYRKLMLLYILMIQVNLILEVHS